MFNVNGLTKFFLECTPMESLYYAILEKEWRRFVAVSCAYHLWPTPSGDAANMRTSKNGVMGFWCKILF